MFNLLSLPRSEFSPKYTFLIPIPMPLLIRLCPASPLRQLEEDGTPRPLLSYLPVLLRSAFSTCLPWRPSSDANSSVKPLQSISGCDEQHSYIPLMSRSICVYIFYILLEKLKTKL